MLTKCWPLVVLLAILAGPAAPPAAAQTTDDFFNGDVLQEVRLLINSKDWNALRTNYLDNTYYPCDFTWNGITVRNVGIRSRGLGSRNSTKPGLRVDFDRYSSQQKFLGLKSVILDNVTQDPSSMKERLTTMFLAKMGQPASRETHARLYVNNQYFGLYVIVESIDKDFLARTLGENDGYLFEYNYVYEWYFSYLGSELEKYKEVFDIKTRESESMSSIYGPIERMVRTVNDASDSSFESDMSQYLDLTDWATHVGLENVMAEWDGVLGYAGLNNFYLYRNATTGVSRFISWDKDNTFRSPTYFIRAGIAGNVLARRLTSIQSFTDHYYNVLRIGADAIEEPMSGLPEGAAPASWLRYHIDRIYLQIRDAMLADTAKPYTNDEFEASIEELRTFAAQRPVYLRCEVLKETSRDQSAIDAACRNAPGQ